MKKCLLLSLMVLSFTSFSHADPKVPTLVCRGSYKYLNASLSFSTKAGTVAHLRDGYDSAPGVTIEGIGRYGLPCKNDANAIVCEGRWALGEKAPVKIVFAKDKDGNISATFNRSSLWDNETVTYPGQFRLPKTSE
jgi:hypothetical protein